jgi:hypothetical protein
LGLNGSELINNPLNTITSVFTNIIGSAFWLIPIGAIAVALYVKTKQPVVSSVWLIASCLMLGSGNLFVDAPEMAIVFYLFAGIGFVGLILNIYLMKG